MDLVDQNFDILPVEDYRNEIVSHITGNQIIICIGETGSGKTTKIPQFCLDENLLGSKIMAITQPRRVAAISVAQRVSDERKSVLGHEVGYSIRFDDHTSSVTRLKYMTDGILVRECLDDPILSRYSIIMLDEAHERSIHTDILFGLVKKACSLRTDLKVLITSATLDYDKFSKYFDNCPVINIPGRIYPVDIFHSKMMQVMTPTGPSNKSYVQAAVEIVMKIHMKEDDGHILVFLTGQDEIENACHLIRQSFQSLLNKLQSVQGDLDTYRPLIILPLFSAQNTDLQRKVFQKAEACLNDDMMMNNTSVVKFTLKPRKCVVATNIAETSVTIPNIRYVVDSGFVKQKTFDPIRRIESLIIVPISQVAAQQRAGRAGRTGPGQCYRLYSSESFQNMLPATVPEILRTNLSNTVLYLKVLGIEDVLAFDFIEPPDADQVAEALVELHLLGAIDNDGVVTSLGRKMSHFPVEPNVSRMLIESSTNDCDCFVEMAAIAAMLSTENIWASLGSRGGHETKSNELRMRQENAHAAFRHPRGDHFTYLEIFKSFEMIGGHSRSQYDSEQKQWCYEHFIQYRAMRSAMNIRDLLMADASKINLSHSEKDNSYRSDERGNERKRKQSKKNTLSLETRLLRAISSGLFMNVARKCTSDTIFKSVPLTLPTIDDPVSEFIGEIKSKDNRNRNMFKKKRTDEINLLHFHSSCSLNYSSSSTTSEYAIYQELIFTGKLCMRHVIYADAEILRDYRSSWIAIHPLILSGRSRSDLLRNEINQKHSAEMNSGPDIELKTELFGLKRSHSDFDNSMENVEKKTEEKVKNISAARERYLARKR